MPTRKIGFQIVGIWKPLETRFQLRFGLLLSEIYRTLVQKARSSNALS
jgi:hypothetical protein